MGRLVYVREVSFTLLFLNSHFTTFLHITWQNIASTPFTQLSLFKYPNSLHTNFTLHFHSDHLLTFSSRIVRLNLDSHNHPAQRPVACPAGADSAVWAAEAVTVVDLAAHQAELAATSSMSLTFVPFFHLNW
jgi:hypothetical protein